DNSYMVLAAMLLCDLGRQSDADAVIEKHNEIIQRMKKTHPVLTDSSDISYVILLALSDRTADSITEDIETCLDHLKKECKIKVGSDSVQGLGEILALTDGDIFEKCNKVIKLYDLLKDNKVEIGGTGYSSLGMLISIDEAPEVIVGEILEADEYLKQFRLFGKESEDRSQRLMFAELLVASSYGTGTSMINNAFINCAFGVLKAQQIVAVISVISNVLPAVLGAVTDSESGDTDSGDTAGPESGEV
ncbi:MAG: DUF4003 family protein, partial [Oscillospiraceae bacterium]|nr:DUF4003 family protein [Oscillospiraceae bacterium]